MFFKGKNYIEITCISCFLITQLSFGQIKVSEIISPSKTANNKEKKLFFVEFWATWCGPCVYAQEYLEILQKKYPDDFYVASLSNENPDLIKRYLKKRNTELAVYIDYEGETFNSFNIKFLPYGILLNAYGQILWKGKPTDFKQIDLERFLEENKKKNTIDNFFTLQESNKEKPRKDLNLKNNFEIKEIKNHSLSSLQIVPRENYLEINGDLISILSYELKIAKEQLEIPVKLNKKYQILAKNDSDVLSNLLDFLNLKLNNTKIKSNALVLKIKTPTFWDTNQINWEADSKTYLVDDYQIQADNASLKDVMYQLAIVLETPVILINKDIDINEKHDWQFHYKYHDLMKVDLLDNYGIEVDKQEAIYTKYTITKQVP